LTADRVLGAYIRGRLVIAGITARTAITDVLDVITVIAMDCPGDALQKWRTGMDRALATRALRNPDPVAAKKADRASWGLAPGQVESQRAFIAQMGGE
jgi:hypothetical protein